MTKYTNIEPNRIQNSNLPLHLMHTMLLTVCYYDNLPAWLDSMYVFILGERNPNGKDPHITATENAQTSASFPTHGNSTLFIAADHRNPCAIFPVMKNIKI